MLTVLAVAESGGTTPLWVYIFGAIGAIGAVLLGTITLYSRVRQSRDAEVTQRTENTVATRENTKAMEGLTARFDDFIRTSEARFQRQDAINERTDERIRYLERGRPRRPDSG